MMFYYSILTTILLGASLCLFFFKQKPDIKLRFIINLFIPIGIGLSSVIFISFNLLGFSLFSICLIETLFIVFLLYKSKVRQMNGLLPKNIINFNKLGQNPILLLIIAVYFYGWLLDASIFFFDSIKEPHGLWDAWNYWNLKAKFISQAPEIWPSLFMRMLSQDFHVDYPLLQTGFIARCWLGLKNETVWIPIILSFIFTFCTIGLLSSSVSYLTSPTKGFIAGLILLCTPFYMTMGDSQYADNTVGFFFLATIVLLTYARNQNKFNPNLFVATGITAGLSAWSKNEGLLFIACLLLAQLSVLFYKNYRELIREMRYLFYGMIPILVLIMYYKLAIAAPNDIIQAQGTETLAKLKDLSRYQTITEWYTQTFSTFGKWFINPWWLFLIAILYKGISIRKYRTSIIPHILWLVLMITGFFLIYVITPLPLIFHLSTSVHRLFFQLFPAFIFIFFIILREKSYIQEKGSL